MKINAILILVNVKKYCNTLAFSGGYDDTKHDLKQLVILSISRFPTNMYNSLPL